jgi:sulfatase modifying factor 1
MTERLVLRFSFAAAAAIVLILGLCACSNDKPPRTGVEPVETTIQPSLGDSRTRLADDKVMVFVPEGALTMGSNEFQVDYAKRLCEEHPDSYGKCISESFEIEQPQHLVKLDGFWIDLTEVTSGQYELCVADSVCRPSRLATDSTYSADDLPVAAIPWKQAVEYCAWAGGRLPNEAEWEYAARGPDGLIFPWGDEFECQRSNDSVDCSPCDDGYSGPAPVGSFPSGESWVGARDLAGNVWEWVSDEPSESALAYGSIAEDQTSDDFRILRGGSWGYCPAFLRSAYRYVVEPEADYRAVGFRCVIDSEQMIDF